MTDFKRDHGRYIVIKLKDLDEQQIDDLRGNLIGIRTRECVVIEPDWPIYEETWENVQRLAEGRPSIGDERDALAAHVERFNTLMRELHSESDCGDESDGDPIPAELWGLWREKPDTSLASVRGEVRRQVAEEWELGLPRLKAEWQAEALELLRDHLGPDQNTPQDDGFDAGWDAAFESIGKRAAELRRKAEENES